MHTKSAILTLRVISPLHAGTGDDNGLVDLSIQREVVTGYPKIEASTLKGALRSRLEQLGADALKIHLAFGYDENSAYKASESFSGDGDASNYAQFFTGALTFTDARLLAFPVRSMRGVFALVTCPYVLRRLAEEAELLLGKTDDFCALKSVSVAQEKCQLAKDSPLLNQNNKVILEEYCFDKESMPEELTKALAKLASLDSTRLVILHDDVFADFTQLFTERITRNAIDDETGAVKDGALFTEEYLPPEAVLYSIVLADKPRQPVTQVNDKGEEINEKKVLPGDFNTATQVLEFIKTNCWNGQTRKFLQIGGNTSVGKGIVELIFNGKQP
jgi:CRISPR-associated protein Cmr4